MIWTMIFIIAQLLITSFIMIYYVSVFKSSEQAKKERDEKRKVEFYNKTVTGTWETGEEPYISYKTTKN